MNPKALVGLGKELNYGPTNRKSFDMLSADVVAKLPGSPEQLKILLSLDLPTQCTNLNIFNSTTPLWKRPLKRPLPGSHCEIWSSEDSG